MKDCYDEEVMLCDKKLSDMMRDYLETQKKYEGCIIAYRCGDFFETYGNGAILLNKYLGLKPSIRSCGIDGGIAMCGYPARSAVIHFNRMLQNGYSIVVVEQVEDPKEAKGRLVKREVVLIITPGTIVDEEMLMGSSNNFLACATINENDLIGFSYVDISTGETYASCFDFLTLKEELARVRPTEMVILDEDLKIRLLPTMTKYNIREHISFDDVNPNILKQYFSTSYLKDLSMPIVTVKSLEQLLSYVFYTQKKIAKNIDNIIFYNVEETMLIDGFTRDSLELVKSMKNEKKGSLYDILDYTKTAMGSRKLKQRIEQPYMKKDTIEKQLNIIEELTDDMVLTENLRKLLNHVYDIERLCGRLAFERITPKEMIQLRNSLEHLPDIKESIMNSKASNLCNFINKLDTLEDIYELLCKAIADEPKNNITEGDIIKTGYNSELDVYRDFLSTLSENLNKLEAEEKRKWGNTIKIILTDADGYCLEITKRVLKLITLPEEYLKVKELSNKTRFMFPELRKLQSNKLEAISKSNALENQLYCKVRDILTNNIERLKNVASLIAQLDVLLSLSMAASLNHYVKPKLNEEHIMNIKNGRHPVIEQYCNTPFISNDFYMDKDKYIYVITGPNMSGKSTYMRQIALIILMAQIGSFVPCDDAYISICDRIFTRIGASDSLSEGKSTFMVEMDEFAQILNNATDKSFTLLDEIGRGTNVLDGISIAKSSIRYFAEKIHCFTLFSTHYFELIDLEKQYPCIQNYKVDVLETEDDIEFLRKVVKGSSTKSYGVHVAKIAGVPEEIIEWSKEELKTLEDKNNKLPNIITKKKKASTKEKTVLSETEENIIKLDLNNMTPMESFKYMIELQTKLNTKKKNI